MAQHTRLRPPIGLDFETYGSRSLPEVGLDNYVSDPNFRPLLASIAVYREGVWTTNTFDFVVDPDGENYLAFVHLMEREDVFIAHNRGFETRVLRRMGLLHPGITIMDSAVISRCTGGSSKLEFAAAQLLDMPKLESGRRLIQKFCIGPTPPHAEDVIDDPDWAEFKRYCERDALLSAWFAVRNAHSIGTLREELYEEITSSMNELGWPVDLELVREMQARALRNADEALAEFRRRYDKDEFIEVKDKSVLKPKLNLASGPQLKKWCADRGIKSSSFDDAHVQKLIDQISNKLTQDANFGLHDPQRLPFEKYLGYREVLAMLRTKQIIGGSSLTKLPKILALTSEDGRLRNQYMHCGAGQTYRTSGTGVQMQNLKRLGAGRHDVDTIFDDNVEWSNEDLAANLRQCFTASHPQGALIVGDLSSVESRGLAFLAGEHDKLEAYRQGKDLYKVLAQKFYGVNYDDVSKEQRQTGKVGELSCGYGAAAGAVSSFAQKMGVEMSEEQAGVVVANWRQANPAIVALWDLLQTGLHLAADGTEWSASLANEFQISISFIEVPASLARQHPGCRSVQVRLDHSKQPVLSRTFHGLYRRGRDICYYKPCETLGGQPWSAFYRNPKTKQLEFYRIYGGKLTGILVQSLCRELFFRILLRVYNIFYGSGVELIGQFHDEIVLNWDPTRTSWSREYAISRLERAMTDSSYITGFPLGAEVKSDYRYTK